MQSPGRFSLSSPASIIGGPHNTNNNAIGPDSREPIFDLDVRKVNNKMLVERRFFQQKLNDLNLKLKSQSNKIDRLTKGCTNGNGETIEQKAEIQRLKDAINQLNIRDTEQQSEIHRLKNIISQFVQATNEAMYCPIEQGPTTTLYVLHGCGHTFSPWGLHGSLQRETRNEHLRLKHLYKLSVPSMESLADYPYNSRHLQEFYERSASFKPSYACPLCREPLKYSPTACHALQSLGIATQKLTHVPVEVEEIEILPKPFPCDISEYFIFFQRKKTPAVYERH